jgi:hypothetical protein
MKNISHSYPEELIHPLNDHCQLSLPLNHCISSNDSLENAVYHPPNSAASTTEELAYRSLFLITSSSRTETTSRRTPKAAGSPSKATTRETTRATTRETARAELTPIVGGSRCDVEGKDSDKSV